MKELTSILDLSISAWNLLKSGYRVFDFTAPVDIEDFKINGFIQASSLVWYHPDKAIAFQVN